MIKLERPIKPERLTDEVKAELTEKFKNTGDDVWNKQFIRKPLMEMSFSKCCYCETKVDEESKYMTVDHYHCKDIYPEEVVEWTNLLPSCSRCNSNKSIHDTYIKPIVDPTIQDPRELFYLHNYRLRCKNKDKESMAFCSIGVLDLNNTEKIVKVRFTIGEFISEAIDDIYEKTLSYQQKMECDIRKINKIRRMMKRLLGQAQSCEEYSAFAATLIISDPDFTLLMKKLSDLQIWDQEMEDLYQNALNIKFDTQLCNS